MQLKRSSAELIDQLNEYEYQMIEKILIDSDDVSVQFEHVGGLEAVKNAIEEEIILPIRRPELFHGTGLGPGQGVADCVGAKCHTILIAGLCVYSCVCVAV